MKDLLKRKRIKALLMIFINIVLMFFSFYAYFKDINFNFRIHSQSPVKVHLYYWNDMDISYEYETMQFNGETMGFMNFDIPMSCSHVKINFESEGNSSIYIDNVNLIKAFNNTVVTGLDQEASKGITSENDGIYELNGEYKSLDFVNLKGNIKELLDDFNWFFNFALFILLCVNIFVLFGFDISYKNLSKSFKATFKCIKDNMNKTNTIARIMIITVLTLLLAVILSISEIYFQIDLKSFSGMMVCVVLIVSTLELLYEFLGKHHLKMKNYTPISIAQCALINYVTYYIYILFFGILMIMIGNSVRISFIDLSILYSVYQFYSFTLLVLVLYLQNKIKDKVKVCYYFIALILISCLLIAVLGTRLMFLDYIPIYPIFLRMLLFVNGKSSSIYFITIFIHIIICSFIMLLLFSKKEPLYLKREETTLNFKFNFPKMQKKYKIGLITLTYIIMMIFLSLRAGNPLYAKALSNKGEFWVNISQEYKIEQTLISTRDELSGIGLPLIKTKDSNSYIDIKLSDENEKVIFEKRVSNEEIDNAKKTIIRFNPIPHSINKKYKLVLSSDVYHSPIYVMANKSDADNYLDGSVLTINGLTNENNINYVEIVTNKDTNVYLMITITIIYILVLLHFLKSKRMKDSYVIICIYLIAILFNVFKGGFYIEHLGHFPDEEAHIGYLAYVHENEELIPKFENIKLVNNCVKQKHETVCDIYEESVSYLGHPPVYYKILDIFNVISVSDGKVFVNMFVLRIINLVMSNFSLAIYFYLGYQLLNKNKLLNLFFAISCISIPLMSYLSGAVTNDNLAFVGSAIFFLGAYKFLNKENFISYLLIALGITIGIMAKLTSGILLLLCAIGFIAYKIIREKSIKCILRKEFLLTLPFYLIVCVYFLLVYFNYGTFQPSQRLLDEEFFKTTIFYVEESARAPWNRWDHAIHYWKSFRTTWTGIFSHVKILKGFDAFTLDTFGISTIMYMPFLYLFSKKAKDNRKKNEKVFLKIAITAIYITMIIQFIKVSNDFQITGYTGGFQTRYYLSVAPVLVLSTTFVLRKTKSYFSNNNLLSKLTDILIWLLLLLMLYEDFIYFLITCTDFL